jgi:sulfhydrogenase subunit beta (sulfur reductase)
MTANTQQAAQFLRRNDFAALFDVLHQRGYRIIGPTLDQGAVVYREIASVAELPRGWTDQQQPAQYRLLESDEDRLFGYTIGPHSWKQFLFPPAVTVAEADRADGSWQFRSVEESPPKYAFLGVRACDLAAIAVQDRTFLEGPYVDPVYQGRRSQALVIAVNCTTAASTCFCTSMGTGPRCTRGFDLALTEIDEGFLIEVGTDAGQSLLDALSTSDAHEGQLEAAESARRGAVEQITRRMDTTDIRDLLLGNLTHPRWDDVARRCLSCTNCTMVCPTCFCASVEEVADLRQEHVERRRVWDSCFNVDFSYINGGVVRRDIRARYRQWLTHKLASWIDQFGVSGCVGCGRCITWCPVGIDLTQEVAALREAPG